MNILCYLDREDIPPIGELEHIKGRCFCYLCTCGQHKCPSILQYQKQSAKVNSSYKQKFTGRQSVPPKPFESLNEMIPSKQKMNLISTSQEDFKPFDAEIDFRIQEPHRRTVSPFKFYGKSTYHTNFIDYQLENRNIEKKSKEIVSPLKFYGKSSYAEDFIKHNQPEPVFENRIKNENILGKGAFTLLDTTHNSTYIPHSNRFVTLPYKHNSVDYTLTNSPSPSHYKTTYTNSFFTHSPTRFKPTLQQAQRKPKKGLQYG